MRHPYWLAVVGGEESGMHRDIPDDAASDVEACPALGIEPGCRRIDREYPAPDAFPVRHVGERKLDQKAEATQKRRIDRVAHVRGQDREAAIRLHPLQQIADLKIGVTVVALLDLGALA